MLAPRSGTVWRTLAVRVLVLLDVVVGMSAVGGAVMLLVDGAGLPSDALAGTPFATWLVPAVALFAVVGVPMLLAGSAYLWAPARVTGLSVLAGLALLAWMAAEITLFREFSPLQPTMVVLGGVILALAAVTRPDATRDR